MYCPGTLVNRVMGGTGLANIGIGNLGNNNIGEFLTGNGQFGIGLMSTTSA
jgi:hypothetical protein